ncbi:MAG: DUF4382 domain-containing protein [Conexivisphaerales archaeon]
MASKTRVIAYGIAAVAVAILLIAASAFIPSFLTGTRSSTQTTQFYVLLTDPPTVPQGTSYLNLTYSSISIHVIEKNGSNEWLTSNTTGTVDLLALYQANASIVLSQFSIPANSTVDKISLAIESVSIGVDGSSYNVTPLANNLTINIVNASSISSKAGAILDLSPTVVEIVGTNATGGKVLYFTMVPSAVAVVKVGLSNLQVGQHVKLSDEDQNKLDEAASNASNLTISKASISVNGNITKISINITNDGSTNATVFGIVIHGQFNSTLYLPGGVCNTSESDNGDNNSHAKQPCVGSEHEMEIEHPDSLAFKINATSDTLVPLFGDQEDNALANNSMLVLKPGQSVNLTFYGIIQLVHQPDDSKNSVMEIPSMIITPIPGQTYQIRLMGEGFETITVVAS